MTTKFIEKLVKKKLDSLLSNYRFQDESFFYFIDGKYDSKFFFNVKRIGREEFLTLAVSVRICSIEYKWYNYIADLGLQEGLFYESFYNTFNHLKENTYSIAPYGIVVEENEEWINAFVEFVVNDNFLPFIEKLKDIKYCDRLINKDIEITDETCKLSPIDGLPFRKIFIAEEAGNPRLPEIKEAMRKYVNQRYKTGIEKNYEKLTKIKPVFEKLFEE